MQVTGHTHHILETGSRRSVQTAAVAVTAAIAVATLYFAREVLIPLTLAALLSFVLAPLVRILRRARLPRPAAVTVAGALALGVCVGLGAILSTQLATLAGDLPVYERTLREKIRAVRSAHSGDSALERASTALRQLGDEITASPDPSASAVDPSKPAASPLLSPDSQANPQPEVRVILKEPVDTPLKLFANIISPVLGPLAAAGLVLLFTIFILLQREDLRDRFIRLFGARDLNRTTVAMDDAAGRLSRFFLVQAALNSTFGVAVGVALSLIGIPSPLLWGMLAGIMRFVPYIGSVVAAVFPIALAAAVDPGWTMVVLTALVFVIGEPIMGHIIEPLAYGRQTGLSPLAIVASATFWTWLWGPIGLILATPLTLCLVVLGQHVEKFEFLTVLLGSEPALEPEQRFYQRLLAGDVVEIRQQAETMLKEQALVDYYDDVALPGLRLALHDERRGNLDEERILEVSEAVDELVAVLETSDVAINRKKHRPKSSVEADEDSESEGLARLDEVAANDATTDVDPASIAPEWKADGAIVIVAGRGSFDQASAELLVQLLRKAGFGAEARGSGGLTGIAEALEQEGARRGQRLIVSTVGGATPAQIRLLVRRAERAAPGLPVVIGAWAADDEDPDLAWLRRNAGARGVVTSFADLLGDLYKTARFAAATERVPGDAEDAASKAVAEDEAPRRVSAAV